MSESWGKTNSLISCENGIFACGNHAQWYGSEIRDVHLHALSEKIKVANYRTM